MEVEGKQQMLAMMRMNGVTQLSDYPFDPSSSMSSIYPTNLYIKASPTSSQSPTSPVSSNEKKECAVCKNPNSSGYHFGCIACAACSAFFRRTVVLSRRYYCRRDPVGNSLCPLDRRHRSNCRACRYVRCIDMGMNPSSVQNLRDSIKPSTFSPKEDVREEEEEEIKKEDIMFSAATPGSWISSASATSNDTIASVTKDMPGENYIEILLEVYERSVERRRMFYGNGDVREMIGGTGLNMRLTHFDERYYKDRMRFELVVYIEMMNHLKVFSQMDLDTKEALVKNCAVHMAMLEKYYVSLKIEGLKGERLIAPDGSYMDLTNGGSQFKKEEFDEKKLDQSSCLELLYNPLHGTLRDMGHAMTHAQMTDTELCALFAVMMFNTAADKLSESSKNAVMMARNRVLKDWFELYAKRGKTTEEASLLVGNTLLLLSSVRKAMTVHRENFHVIRVFDVMTYDKLIDDLNFF